MRLFNNRKGIAPMLMAVFVGLVILAVLGFVIFGASSLIRLVGLAILILSAVAFMTGQVKSKLVVPFIVLLLVGLALTIFPSTFVALSFF